MNCLYIVRHGETLWNVAKRMQGRLDSPLSELGRQQAIDNGRVLKSQRVDRLIVSPLGRTIETANLINSSVRLPLEFDDRLVERDCGEWAGLTLDEVEERFPAGWRTRREDPYEHRPPGGESYPDMIERLAPLIAEMRASNAIGRVAFVTHSALGRALIAALMNLNPQRMMSVRLPNDLIYRINFDDAHSADHFQAGKGPVGGLLHQS